MSICDPQCIVILIFESSEIFYVNYNILHNIFNYQYQLPSYPGATLTPRLSLSKVRLHVVTVYHEFITRLGQDYSALLPDTLPFLAELLEDSDPEVEEITHTIVKTIEATTGESMDQYL